MKMLQEFEPQLPLPSLVEQLNRIYHANEARGYDRMHPEIHAALPAKWTEMLSHLPRRRAWKVLDFGCGTGFEASQAISALNGSLDFVACYDPSPEMLARCKDRLGSHSRVAFLSDFSEIVTKGTFDLLLTNALLHHLPNVESTLEALRPSLKSDAFWLAGHEPSARFYRNPNCCRLLKQYSRQRRWLKYFEPNAYVAKLRRTIGMDPDPLKSTTLAAFEQGLFKKRPTEMLVSRLVDLHVPHSEDEAKEGRGFDYENLQALWKDKWSLKLVKTYSFLGFVKEGSASSRWQRKAHQLAAQFPGDGAHFCCVWKRIS
jgi:ubiquinone/menaquinone biosynthesis C-methylase UbiE